MMTMFDIFLNKFVEVDILKFTTYDRNLPTSCYFDIKKYPITDEFLGEGFENLKIDIQKKATDFGYSLFCNGGISNYLKPNYKDFRHFKCCNNSRTFTD